MTKDDTRMDLILKAIKKIGNPQLNDEMIQVISKASGKTPQEIINQLKENG